MTTILIQSISSASADNIVADDYLIQRVSVSGWQVNPDQSLSVFMNRMEYVFTDRQQAAAVWDWCNPDRVDDEGLTPRWRRYVIDWDNVGAPTPPEGY